MSKRAIGAEGSASSSKRPKTGSIEFLSGACPIQNPLKMKTDMPEGDTSVSKYQQLLEQYKPMFDGLKRDDSPLGQWMKSEKAAIKDSTYDQREKTLQRARVNDVLYGWKKSAFLAFQECIKELAELANSNAELRDQANSIKNDFEKLLKGVQPPISTDVKSILKSLDIRHRCTMPKTGDKGENRRVSSAKYRYCVKFEESRSTLDAALDNEETSEELKSRIQEHKDNYQKLQPTRLKGKKKISTDSQVQDAQVQASSVEVSEDPADISTSEDGSDSDFDSEDSEKELRYLNGLARYAN